MSVGYRLLEVWSFLRDPERFRAADDNLRTFALTQLLQDLANRLENPDDFDLTCPSLDNSRWSDEAHFRSHVEDPSSPISDWLAAHEQSWRSPGPRRHAMLATSRAVDLQEELEHAQKLAESIQSDDPVFDEVQIAVRVALDMTALGALYEAPRELIDRHDKPTEAVDWVIRHVRRIADQCHRDFRRLGAAMAIRQERGQTADPFAGFRELMKSVPLGGIQRQVCDAILDGGGSIKVEALVDRIETWSGAENWKSAKQYLNRKFQDHGWRFSQQDGRATINENPRGDVNIP